MKDSYSFDADVEGLEKSYQLHTDAYNRIFQRCGLHYYMVDSDPGMMGGATAHEFMAPSPAGEDQVLYCSACGYAANIELAVSVPPPQEPVEMKFEEVHTPDQRTIREVAEFLDLSPDKFIKSLVFIFKKRPVMILVRGDHELHEKKAERIIGQIRAAHRDEISAIFNTPPGYIGPRGQKMRIIADNALKEGTYVAGANKVDYHIKGLKPDVHFEAQWYDLHVAKEGEGCPKCSKPLTLEKTIEIGNIFKLGSKYSEAMNAMFLDKKGVVTPIVMGSYGIGPARVAAAAIEQNHDINGIIWPDSIAPFSVIIIPVNVNDTETLDATKKIYDTLTAKGLDVLLDDRDERAGVKFKDADLIGIPYQIILGPKTLKEGMVEVKCRRTGEIRKVTIDETITMFKKLTYKVASRRKIF